MNWKTIWLVAALLCFVFEAVGVRETQIGPVKVRVLPLAGAALAAYLLA
jgi:hypothetical protein